MVIALIGAVILSDLWDKRSNPTKNRTIEMEGFGTTVKITDLALMHGVTNSGDPVGLLFGTPKLNYRLDSANELTVWLKRPQYLQSVDFSLVSDVSNEDLVFDLGDEDIAWGGSSESVPLTGKGSYSLNLSERVSYASIFKIRKIRLRIHASNMYSPIELSKVRPTFTDHASFVPVKTEANLIDFSKSRVGNWNFGGGRREAFWVMTNNEILVHLAYFGQRNPILESTFINYSPSGAGDSEYFASVQDWYFQNKTNRSFQ